MWSNKARYQYPLTPGNKASLLDLVTEPTSRTAGDMLTIGFEADPAVVRAYVPEPMEIDPSGLCYLRVFDVCVFTERNQTELLTPERYEFAEAFFWVPCTYNGELYHHMTFSYGDRDWLCYGGRGTGMPHKLAKVQMTRFHPADPVYYGPHDGVRISFSVENVGLLMRGWLDFEREVSRDSDELPISISMQTPKYLGERFFWDSVEDRPMIHDLVAHWGDDRRFGPVWAGDASLTFYDAEGEELMPFQPRRIVGGWWHTMSFNHGTSTPEIIHTFE
jgi:hypothetical protein